MDNEEMTTKKKPRKHFGLLLFLVIIIAAIATILYLGNNYKSFMANKAEDVINDSIIGQEGTVSTISQQTLDKVFEISDLSSVNYTYNAIAKAYDDDGTTVKYYIAYNGTVTAGIDFSQIIKEIDDENKTITIKIPNCKIISANVDYGTMDYIMSDPKYDVGEASIDAYDICKADLNERADKETEMMTIAKENAIASVEALVKPWIKQALPDYTVNIY